MADRETARDGHTEDADLATEKYGHDPGVAVEDIMNEAEVRQMHGAEVTLSSTCFVLSCISVQQ